MTFEPRKINFILDFLFDPCDAPMTMWVRTAFPALMHAVWMYFADFDPKQILISYVRPARAMLGVTQRSSRAMNAPRSRKKGKSGGQRVVDSYRRPSPYAPGLGRRLMDFDLNNEAGKKLPGAREFRGRKVRVGVAWLWVIEGVVERVLWWILIFELVGGFLFEWFSALIAMGYCQQEGVANMLARREELFTAALFGWVGTPIGNVVKQRGPCGWNVSSGGVANTWAIAAFTATIDNHQNETIVAGLRIVYHDKGIFHHEVTVPPFGSAELAVSVELSPHSLITIEDRISFGFATWRDLQISIMGRDLKGLYKPGTFPPSPDE